MKKVILSVLLAIALLPSIVLAQCTLANFTSVANLGPGSFPYLTSSGITMNVSAPGVPTLGNTSYSCNAQNFACAPTAWWPNATSHVITVTFSAPVSRFSVVINGTNQNEIFTFVGSSSVTTLSDYCTASFSTVAANQLLDFAVPATGTLITINNLAGATSFTITHNGVGSGSRLSFLNCVVPAVPFGVSMNDFEADYRPITSDVDLHWNAFSETNFSGYEVQHSLDGNAWEALGFVQGVGTNAAHAYDFVHTNPINGVNYYRLRLVDLNANYEFSEVRMIEIAASGDLATIFPNPTAGQFEVRAAGRKGQLEVMDMLGRSILQVPFESQLELNLSDQAAGAYWIKISDQKGRVTAQRLVLQ